MILPHPKGHMMVITKYANFSARYKDFANRGALELSGIIEPNVGGLHMDIYTHTSRFSFKDIWTTLLIILV